MAGANEGIRIAFSNNTYDTNPTWTRIDDPNLASGNVNMVVGWTTDRGRQYELDKTQAGTATLNMVDTTGVMDPNNPSSPFFGKILPLKQAKISVQNPVDGLYHDIFTGYVESWDFTPDKSQKWNTITLQLVDGFELLSRAEVVPDSTGTTTYAAQQVDDRIKAALADDVSNFTSSNWQANTVYASGTIVTPTVANGFVFQAITAGTSGGSQPAWPTTSGATVGDNTVTWQAIAGGAGWPSSLTNIFTGNVTMQQTVYNPQTSLLGVMQDAADAEFPNVANVFMDRWGRVAFRGRWPRFFPDFYSSRSLAANPPPGSQQLYKWFVGDFNAANTFGYVPIHSIEWAHDLKNIINACLCLPYNANASTGNANVSAQLQTNSASITQYGVRAITIPDLLVETSVPGPSVGPPTHAPGGDGVTAPASDSNNLGLHECQIFAYYYVHNYNQSVERITNITFQSIDPNDPLGAAWWQFVTGVEIGDIVVVNTTQPWGGGFKQVQFFVEGIHNQVTLGGPVGNKKNIPQWTMTLDLSPRAYYQSFPYWNGSTFVNVVYFTP